jgi:hypothetical protein
MAIALFSYIGVEVASSLRARSATPTRTSRSPRCRHACLRRCLPAVAEAVFGIVPSTTLEKSNAPFSTAINAMFGGNSPHYFHGCRRHHLGLRAR